MADDIVQTISIRGASEATNEFDRLAVAGEKAFDRLQQAGDRVGNIGKGIDQAAVKGVPQLNRMEKAAEDLGRSLGNTAKAAVTFGTSVAKLGLIAGAAAAGGIFALAKSASTLTSALKEGSIRAGTSAQNFAKLGFAVEQSGGNMQKLERAFAVLATGEKATEDALAKFGVRLKNANGTARDGSEVFTEFAEAVAGIRDPAQRTAAAAEVFGRRLGPGLVETLQEGRKGLAEFGREAQKFGLVFTDVELKVGKTFGDSLNKLGRTFSSLAARIGLAFSPALIVLFDRLSDGLAAIAPRIVAVANAIGGALNTAIKGITSALGPTGTLIAATVAAFAALALGVGAVIAVLSPLAGFAALIFAPLTLAVTAAVAGFKLLVGAVGIAIASLRLLGLTAAFAFGPIGIAIALVTAAIGFFGVALLRGVNFGRFGELATSTFRSIVLSAASAGAGVIAAWRAVEQFFVTLWTGLTQLGTSTWELIVAAATAAVESIVGIATAIAESLLGVWTGIQNAAVAAWNAMRDGALSAFNVVRDAVQPVVDAIQRIIDVARRAASALLGIGGGGAGAPSQAQGLAGGGRVRGPGSKTSDSILARLSRGEYVVRAAAVDKYGVGIFEALNGLRLPLRALRGFAQGGLVDALSTLAPVPRHAYADGGLVAGGGGRPIVLNIGDQSFNLTTRDDETAERIGRYATVRRVRSAGRKPTYYGGGL